MRYKPINMKHDYKKTFMAIVIALGFGLQGAAQTPTQKISAANIPPSDPSTYKGVVGKTLAESKEWWAKPLKAPQGAPNIVWILLDDVGFGASEAFGVLTIEQEIK